VYVGKEKGETSHYVSEKAEVFDLFLKIYDIDRSIKLMSDNGTSYGSEENDYFVKKGITKRFRYPACVHQLLSPNDNKFHGEAKAKWRAGVRDWSDGVDVTLRLMHELDNVPGKHVRSYFSKNFCLQSSNLTVEEVKAHILKTGKKFAPVHKAMLASYRSRFLENQEYETSDDERDVHMLKIFRVHFGVVLWCFKFFGSHLF
jgi:hypothetical protein